MNKGSQRVPLAIVCPCRCASRHMHDPSTTKRIANVYIQGDALPGNEDECEELIWTMKRADMSCKMLPTMKEWLYCSRQSRPDSE
jgi:hypothetical protein